MYNWKVIDESGKEVLSAKISKEQIKSDFLIKCLFFSFRPTLKLKKKLSLEDFKFKTKVLVYC